MKWRKRRDQDSVADGVLAEAEAEVSELRDRAQKAMQVLNDRANRNHWREAIEELILRGK